MKILPRYIVLEMVVPFLIGVAAIVMLLTGSVLYNNADIFLQNQIPVQYIMRLALYFVPFLVNMTMPVGMAVAASLAVSRMARDSEITVLRASGASLVRIFMPIFVCGLLISVVDFFWGEYVVPASITRFNAVRNELPTQIKQIAPPSGEYITAPDNSYVIGVRNMEQKVGYIDLRGISIVSGLHTLIGAETQPFVLSADHGRYQNGNWMLDNAQIYTYDLRKPENWSRGTARRVTKYINVDPQSFAGSFQLSMPMGKMADSAERTFLQLGEDLKNNRRLNIHNYSAELDYHFKLSVPFSCLVMALCCPPMALRFARGGGFMGTLLSICLVFVYWNTLLLARILGTPSPGGTPILQPGVAAWSQNVLFVVVGLVVLKRSE